MTVSPLVSFGLERSYPAAPERVRASWTRADLLRRWACPEPDWQVSSCEVDARVGGGYRLRFGPRPGGGAYLETATYVVFEPARRLVLDARVVGPDMDEPSRCTVLLVPAEGGTRLQLTVDGLSGGSAAEQFREGWTACLEGIADHLDAAV